MDGRFDVKKSPFFQFFQANLDHQDTVAKVGNTFDRHLLNTDLLVTVEFYASFEEICHLRGVSF